MASLIRSRLTTTVLPITRHALTQCTLSSRSLHTSTILRSAEVDAERAKTVAELDRVRDEYLKKYPDMDIPYADGQERPNEKVWKTFDSIMNLSMFETVALVGLLKKKFGVGALDMSAMGAAPAGGAAAAPAAGAAKPADAKAAATPSTFSVRLDAFEAKDKIAVIKEVRAATGLGLKESKELVETIPKVVKKDLKKEDAEALMKKLTGVGAKVTLE